MIYVIFIKMMDLYIAQWISHFGQGTWLDMVSYIISWWPFLALGLLVIWCVSYSAKTSQRKQYLIALAIGTLLFYLVNELAFKYLLVEYIWGRLRPYIAYPEIIAAIWSQISDSSFPSSHVASTVVVLTLWVWRSSKMWIVAVIIALLMALSRIHNGMHYPTDVLAGTALGIIYAITAIRASKHIIQRRPSLNNK